MCASAGSTRAHSSGDRSTQVCDEGWPDLRKGFSVVAFLISTRRAPMPAVLTGSSEAAADSQCAQVLAVLVLIVLEIGPPKCVTRVGRTSGRVFPWLLFLSPRAELLCQQY